MRIYAFRGQNILKCLIFNANISRKLKSRKKWIQCIIIDIVVFSMKTSVRGGETVSSKNKITKHYSVFSFFNYFYHNNHLVK